MKWTKVACRSTSLKKIFKFPCINQTKLSVQKHQHHLILVENTAKHLPETVIGNNAKDI